MNNENKVFSSTIIRNNTSIKNDLYEILNIVPAKPLSEYASNNQNFDFEPKGDKYYVPKKKHGPKVKTVRDIRNIFEKDVFSYLPVELEKQNNFLLRKIRNGSSRDEKTKQTAKNMLKSQTPISRSAWQMLMNINPEERKFCFQYVLWNGKSIRVCGSKGGKNKFMHKYDLGKAKQKTWHNPLPKKDLLRKNGLLKNSLNVKFKPGPLTKKINLDKSYQKYNFGNLELVNLPKPGLDIQPAYGKPLGPTINTFIHNTFFDAGGIISQKWANFAVSVLGTIKNGCPTQSDKNSNVTFDLKYKCLQNRLLMRHDSDIVNHDEINKTLINLKQTEDEPIIMCEVKNVLNKVIDAVEVSLLQDDIYSGNDEPRDDHENDNFYPGNQLKDKVKRRYGELDRLDVTVIRISETSEENKNGCRNSFCTFGCICDSLKCSYNLKRHCGRIECMFQCKCDFSKYILYNSFDNDCSDILPGLVNLDQKIGQNLAKEEQKFHQTVIVTDDKSILLKSRKRNWKASKKYAEFYSNMPLKTDSKAQQTLSIICKKLDLENVEPWCMVHSLYKCFCNGKFIEAGCPIIDETKINRIENTNITTNIDVLNTKQAINNNKECENKGSDTNKTNIRSSSRHRIREEKTHTNKKDYISDSSESSISFDSCYTYSCARTRPYKYRKYDDAYYFDTNKRILEMEKNDKTLRNKMMTLMNRQDDTIDLTISENTNTGEDPHSNSLTSLSSLIHDIAEQRVHDQSNKIACDKSILDKPINQYAKRLPHKTKLVAWLESSYKQYKQRLDQGVVKIALDAPKVGKVALYPWDFILSRYRDRKNHFLISKQKPFRIFMAIDIRNQFFDNCINISDIVLSDLEKYPVTVKNLLTNATDLKDNFCILCGLSLCWELVGSVTKVKEKRDENVQDPDMLHNLVLNDEKSLLSDNSESNNDSELQIDDAGIFDKINEPDQTSEQTRWFVMTIENDFSEIQFFRKGFFVKYDSVIKAINVARVSGKTVRLSSQKCHSRQNSPQFGIYAIPNEEEYCVFIGPYEKDESLGIETVKNLQEGNIGKSTRGVWITTNKVDNLKVIDNPLLFMPSGDKHDEVVILENDSSSCFEIDDYATHINDSMTYKKPVKQTTSNEIIPKVAKLIKINKKNAFYKFKPNYVIQKVFKNSEKQTIAPMPVVLKPFINNTLSKNSTGSLISIPSSSMINVSESRVLDNKSIFMSKKPVAEIAPQVKQNNGTQKSTIQQSKSKGSMFILKPEEINQRSIHTISPSCPTQSTTKNVDPIESDIEDFLAKSVVCSLQKNVFIITDDEDDSVDTPKIETSKNVWIACKTVESLGWIPGRRNSNNNLSFEFPGFKYTDFYPEEEAFSKINQVLSRKVYIPKHIQLEWHVFESETDINIENKLLVKDLKSEYVLTKRGLRHKFDLIKRISILNKDNDGSTKMDNNEIIDLDEVTDTLEEENVYLFDKTILNKEEILESLSKASEELRQELTEKLNSIKMNAEDLK